MTNVTKVDGGYLHEWIDADGERHKYVHPTNLTHPAPSGQAVAWQYRVMFGEGSAHQDEWCGWQHTSQYHFNSLNEQIGAGRKRVETRALYTHPSGGEWRPTHRHVKTGRKYRLDDYTEAEAATLRARLEAVEGAAAAVLADWDERMPDGPESFRSNAELGFSYWSPSASMVSSEAMSKLRAALEGGDNA